MRLDGYVRVTMPAALPAAGRYDGKDYKFPPETPIDVPEKVAEHIFGFGLDDKTSAMRRLGWAQLSEQMPQALEKLSTVKFDEPPEMIEAPKKAGPKKTGDARPLVNAGGPKVAVPVTAGAVTDGTDEGSDDDVI